MTLHFELYFSVSCVSFRLRFFFVLFFRATSLLFFFSVDVFLSGSFGGVFLARLSWTETRRDVRGLLWGTPFGDRLRPQAGRTRRSRWNGITDGPRARVSPPMFHRENCFGRGPLRPLGTLPKALTSLFGPREMRPQLVARHRDATAVRKKKQKKP